MNRFHIIIFLSFILFEFMIAFNASSIEYQKGLQALRQNNNDLAEKYFRKSIRVNNDTASLFELAKIYIEKDTPLNRFKARKLLKKALAKEETNLTYRYTYAELLENFARYTAIAQYNKILELDSTQSKALYKLACFEEEEFNDYNQSVKTTGIAPVFYQQFANEDFLDAERLFLKAIKFDSTFYDAAMHLAFLYEDAGLYNKGLRLTEDITRNHPQKKEAFLLKGLLAYRSRKIEIADKAFQQGIDLMDAQEKEDYLVNSVDFLLQRLFEDKTYTAKQINYIKAKYWSMSDPVLLTDYNERLTEHYARMAYANLRFSVLSMDIKGWQSDRGKIMLRYGKPINRVRLRPQMGDAGNVLVKTDIWQYEGVSFGFADEYSSGEFRFSVPAAPGSRIQSQFALETQLIVSDMENTEPERYRPIFEGPLLDITYSVAQFRGTGKKTDLYINYGIEHHDSLTLSNENYVHNSGIFFFDEHFEKKLQKKTTVNYFNPIQTISTSDSSAFIVYSSGVSLQADSGFVAFEVERLADKGLFSAHKNFKIKKFSDHTLDLSSVVLASAMDFSENKSMPMIRNDLSFVPNATHTFRKPADLFVYFEIYNLSRDATDFTSFEQQITIRQLTDESTFFAGLIDGVSDFLGLSEEPVKVTLTSNYQTKEASLPVYLQLDVNNYNYGNYELTVTIIDHITGQYVSQKTDLFLR